MHCPVPQPQRAVREKVKPAILQHQKPCEAERKRYTSLVRGLAGSKSLIATSCTNKEKRSRENVIKKIDRSEYGVVKSNIPEIILELHYASSLLLCHHYSTEVGMSSGCIHGCKL